MKVNVLIDGGFLEQALRKQGRLLNAEEIEKVVDAVIQGLKKKNGLSEAQLFRVLYYDCYPFEGTQTNPEGEVIDFADKPIVRFKKALLSEISKKDRYALRLGELAFRGWKVNHAPIFQQKGVDIKCGLDIAVMSMKKNIDLIAIVTGDSDFIAPLKFARKEGVLVALYHMELPVKDDLIRHCDFVIHHE